jgi:ubiquitin carboxyl-terminal hydrolase 4/11/15
VASRSYPVHLPVLLMSLPDSSLPNSPSSSDLIHPQGSRKRQRSRSMQSDSGASSSSLKRSVAGKSASEVSVRSPRTDQMSILNQDIDAYMAEQGEADIPSLMSPQDAAPSTPMPPQEKHSFVQTHKSRRMEVGETWYLVSRGWYKRWSKACTGEVDKEGPVSEQDLGPVNNTPLLDSYSNLLPSIAEGVDVEYVPQEVWDRFVEWYIPPISLLINIFMSLPPGMVLQSIHCHDV